ncbi:MAG: FAD-dependent oxidoreductase [Syntrophomonadaceae bacterium]|nr:FAD-dependent oxidoreductase [Syntrophomonadaceae bacterium]
MKMFPYLFSPAYISGILVKNRVVLAPMSVGYAGLDGGVSDSLIAYYEARAKGGVGLVIVEAASVDNPGGRGNFRQLNIDHPRCIPGLERLASAIKAYGSRALIQLFHAGRQTTKNITGIQPVAPSPLACPHIKEIPRVLKIEEIRDIENKFIRAAHYAYAAGFDGVELNAAHGYLINQFLSSRTNKRQDMYGGSLPGRMRFLLNIAQGIKDAVPGLVLSVRLNIDDFVPGGLNLRESAEIARELEAAGTDAIHCSSGTYESGLTSIEPASYGEGWRIYLAEEIKKQVKIPVIAGGVVKDPGFADQVIKKRRADFVFLARSLLADSDWANKARAGKREDIRPCIMCNNCADSYFRGVGVSCTVNPQAGREKQLKYYAGSLKKNNYSAVVVGSGPAGMQAALSLRQQGLDVTLYEKDGRPGGLLNLASIPPYKGRIAMLRDFLVRQLNKSGVEVLLNRTYGPEELKKRRPDFLVIATGSKPNKLRIKGWEREHCLDLSDVFNKKIEIINRKVVVVGGGESGCEAADFLLAGDNDITIVEESNRLAAKMERKNRRDLMNRLQQGKVKMKTGTRVMEIGTGEVLTDDGSVEADYVVLATGFVPDNDLYLKLEKEHSWVFLIGDAFGLQGIKGALLQGEMIGSAVTRIARYS